MRTIYVVLQKGGTSHEWYGGWCDTESEAVLDVARHKTDSYFAFYKTVEVPLGASDEMFGVLATAMADALANGIALETAY